MSTLVHRTKPAFGGVSQQGTQNNTGEVHGKQPWVCFPAVSFALGAISWSAI